MRSLPAHLAMGTLLCALGIQPARADALGDLVTTLKGLRADTPLKGVMDVRKESVEDGDDPTKPAVGHVVVQVSAGDGISLHVDPALLQQIAAEEAKSNADPDQKQPTADLLRDTGPAKVQHYASQADYLLLELDGANSPGTAPGMLDGTQVTKLSLKLPERFATKDKDSAKGFTDDLVIDLDAQGIPLHYTDTIHVKFCKFFICVTVDQKQDVTLKVVDKRLVVVKLVDDSKQSGAGLGLSTKATTTFTLQ